MVAGPLQRPDRENVAYARLTAPGIEMPQVIIANKLDDGFVVFLTADGNWSNDIDAAALATDESEAERLLEQGLAAERANVVIDPYLIDVRIEDGQRIPTEYREYIRALGPTVPIPS